MINFISNQLRIEDETIIPSSINDCLEYFKDKKYIGLDIETTGFDPYTCRILTIQLGDTENQFVIDNTINFQLLTPLLQDESKVFIGHNLKFDIRFFLYHNIIIKNIYDTFIAEQIIYNGVSNVRKGLDVVVKRHLNEIVDKSIRGNIHKLGIVASVIEYGAKDVAYLEKVMNSQQVMAENRDVTRAIELNNMFVPVIAYLEYCGFKLDRELWQEKIDKDTILLNESLEYLNNYIVRNNIREFIDPQLDLFDDTIKPMINWSSPIQVSKLFKIINIDTRIVDKESGDIKTTVNADFLKKKIEEHPIIIEYIRYRELLKRVGTYGSNWFKFINPITNRIHTKYQQIMVTGRMSSGGKDKSSNIDYPNAQNIPADYDTRRCIVAEKGNMLINADYSGQENVVFANKCLDPTLLKMYDEGIDDMHSYTAWNIFPEIQEKYPELTKETLKLIKKNFSKERQISKTGNFAIAYGGVGSTVADNCNIPIQEGEKFYKNYFKTFKGIKEYFANVYYTSKNRGYIQFNNITRAKYFIPNTLTEFKIKSSAYNFPIQGTAADITKYAGILYWRSLLERNLIFIVKITIICHDEYLLELPEYLAEQEAKILKECMEEAGDRFCKRIKLSATPVITPYWTH